MIVAINSGDENEANSNKEKKYERKSSSAKQLISKDKKQDYRKSNVKNVSRSKNSKVVLDQESESEDEKGDFLKNNTNKNNFLNNKKNNKNEIERKENKKENLIGMKEDDLIQENPKKNKNDFKSKLGSTSNFSKTVKDNPETSKSAILKRITRNSNIKLPNNINQTKNQSKNSESINDNNNNKTKQIIEYNNNNFIENSQTNSISDATSEEFQLNLSSEKKSKSKISQKSNKKETSKIKSKSVSKLSSNSELPLNLPDLLEKNENNNIKQNENKIDNDQSKNESKSNLSFYNSASGTAEETQAELPSDITNKLSNSLIYCREAEKKRVLDFISNKDLKTLFICGQPGTGKTSLLLEIFKNDLGASSSTIKIYINCMSVHSAEDFYFQILKFLFENFNLLGNARDLKLLQSYREVLQISNSSSNNNNNSRKNLNKSFLEIMDLYKSKFTFLVLLDEVDNFYQKQKEIVFYEILNTPYLTDTQMKLMLISNNSEFDKDVMPKIESRKIKVSRIVFKPYTHNEIYEILMKKLSESGILEAFQDEALKLISKKLANKMGDLRPAIEIVKNLILENKDRILVNANNTNNNDFDNTNNKNGDNNKNFNLNTNSNSSNNKNNNNKETNNNEKSLQNETSNFDTAIKAKPLITLRDVLIKLKQKNQSFIELMSNLTTEQKIVLLSFYIVYEKSKNSEIDERLVLDTYKMIKRENFNSEFNIMDYKEIIKSFCDMAIIECKNKGKGKFKIKYDLEDLELIFVDDKIFKMFKGN